MQLLEVESALLDESRQSNGSQVADGTGTKSMSIGERKTMAADLPLIRGAVFDDLGTEIGRLDGTQVLLVALFYIRR